MSRGKIFIPDRLRRELSFVVVCLFFSSLRGGEGGGGGERKGEKGCVMCGWVGILYMIENVNVVKRKEKQGGKKQEKGMFFFVLFS